MIHKSDYKAMQIFAHGARYSQNIARKSIRFRTRIDAQLRFESPPRLERGCGKFLQEFWEHNEKREKRSAMVESLRMLRVGKHSQRGMRKAVSSTENGRAAQRLRGTPRVSHLSLCMFTGLRSATAGGAASRSAVGARGRDFTEGFAERGDGFGDGFAENELAFAAAADQIRVGEDFHVMRNGGGRDAAHGNQVLALHPALRGNGFENLQAGFVSQRLGDLLDLSPVHRHADSIIRF